MKDKLIKQIKSAYYEQVIYPVYDIFEIASSWGNKTVRDFVDAKKLDLQSIIADINSQPDEAFISEISDGKTEAEKTAKIDQKLSSADTDEKKKVLLNAFLNI